LPTLQQRKVSPRGLPDGGSRVWRDAPAREGQSRYAGAPPSGEQSASETGTGGGLRRKQRSEHTVQSREIGKAVHDDRSGFGLASLESALEAGLFAIASLFSDTGAPFFMQILSGWKTPTRESANLGNGTFVYEGAQATDVPEATIWRFEMYGGIRFGGDPRIPDPASLAVALTGPDSLIHRLQALTAPPPAVTGPSGVVATEWRRSSAAVRVPPTPIVPPPASERQSGWVVRFGFVTAPKTASQYQKPPDPR
jgi:hypothetical protein